MKSALVLSTLHTNDAPSAVARLLNMGIEPFLVASSVNLICAQRLVRRICEYCAEPAPLPIKALVDIGFEEDTAGDIEPKRGGGCDRYNRTGYRGRIGLFEVMKVSETIRELILAGASTTELRRQAMEEGMLTLRQSGLCKIKDGATTIEEVTRETAH